MLSCGSSAKGKEAAESPPAAQADPWLVWEPGGSLDIGFRGRIPGAPGQASLMPFGTTGREGDGV